MGRKRQKNQLELAFTRRRRGETGQSFDKGTELTAGGTKALGKDVFRVKLWRSTREVTTRCGRASPGVSPRGFVS